MEVNYNTVVDKIETIKIDKVIKKMQISSIGLIICVIVKLSISTTSQLSSWGWWVDILFFLAFPLYFFIKFKSQLNNRSNQFIKWTTESIIYKLKDETLPQTIQKNQIESVNVNLDIIEIIDKKDHKHILDISDFNNYVDRLKIKENFKKEKKGIK